MKHKIKEVIIDLILIAIATYIICWWVNGDLTWFKLLFIFEEGDMGIEAEGVRNFALFVYSNILVFYKIIKKLDE